MHVVTFTLSEISVATNHVKKIDRQQIWSVLSSRGTWTIVQETLFDQLEWNWLSPLSLSLSLSLFLPSSWAAGVLCAADSAALAFAPLALHVELPSVSLASPTDTSSAAKRSAHTALLASSTSASVPCKLSCTRLSSALSVCQKRFSDGSSSAYLGCRLHGAMLYWRVCVIS